MFGEEESTAFRTVGYVHLPRAVPDQAVAAMQDDMWDRLATKGIRRDDPASWRLATPAHDGAAMVSNLQGLSSGGAGPERCPSVKAAIDSVMGADRSGAKGWGQALATCSVDAPAWLVPRSVWHFDHLYREPGLIEGVNVFLLVEDVGAHAGGTAVVRNSPALMDRFLQQHGPSDTIGRQNKRFIGSHPWLRGLAVAKRDWTLERNDHYLVDTDVDGIDAQVEELTGRAGDVYLCHPALLHAPSMNVSGRMRLMRTQRVRVAAAG